MKATFPKKVTVDGKRVKPDQAKEWFAIMPARGKGKIVNLAA